MPRSAEPARRRPSDRTPRHGLARVLSKRGVCSRSEAGRWIAAGRVSVDGRVVLDPEHPVAGDGAAIRVDGRPLQAVVPRYVMLNKPRGLVTTARDERQRDTVYRCFDGADLSWLAPVGRLDKASEGLLLFSNDPAWAAAITDPDSGPEKIYHVQVDRLVDADLPAALTAGVVDGGEMLSASAARILRTGTRNAWLEIVLEEGRNRQIRRLLGAFDIGVLRLVRVAIGPLVLGELPKGHWRELGPDEIVALAPAAINCPVGR